jgi:transposase
MEDHSIPTPQMPETEVPAEPSAPSSKRSAPPKAKRRQFSPESKRKLIEQYDQLDVNERGALLRREGLYYSHISKWRWQFQQADKKAAAKERAATTKARATVSKSRYDDLKRELEEVRAQLEKANSIIAVQKKLSDLLFANSLDSSSENSK